MPGKTVTGIVPRALREQRTKIEQAALARGKHQFLRAPELMGKLEPGLDADVALWHVAPAARFPSIACGTVSILRRLGPPNMLLSLRIRECRIVSAVLSGFRCILRG